jgi:hypothetical protein
MKQLYCACILAVCGAPGLACDGQQYVSPDTVGLSVTKDSTGKELVNRCNYVPVLLGGEVKSRYVVEGELKATLTVTRDSFSVVFEGAANEIEPFVVPAADVREASQLAPNPPKGYTVTLSSGCTPPSD